MVLWERKLRDKDSDPEVNLSRPVFYTPSTTRAGIKFNILEIWLLISLILRVQTGDRIKLFDYTRLTLANLHGTLSINSHE